MMTRTSITATVISVIYGLLLIFYLFGKNPSVDMIVFFVSVLFIISVFMNFNRTPPESFYFEVSPQRKKCLEEQVSLNPKTLGPRSCACCPKGTVGGYPPHYSQWLQPQKGSGSWSRTDNWTTSPAAVRDSPTPTALIGQS